MEKIKTWIKIGKHFIDQENIHAVSRIGDRTRIERILGKPIIVDIDYKKIVAMLPKPTKNVN
jgi:hypothetical protein